MLTDERGSAVTAASRDVVARLDDAVAAYLGARGDTRARLDAVLAEDPRCVMAHCLDGYLAMLASRRETTERSRAALDRARSAMPRAGASAREAMHVDALDAWSRGDMRGAAARWDALLAEHPRDIVALKVSQFVLSYLGESARMRTTVERVLPAWDAAVPGYGFVLGCHAYALEEAGDYARAESAGRRAVELNRADIWAAHAVAHVAEMQGRPGEGIRWVASVGDAWDGCSNFANHLRWHAALYHLELGRIDDVVSLYEREVRAAGSEEYLDITNAVSLLWRLEQSGADVGARWRELAERSRAHLDDHALVFVDAHYAMALAAAGSPGEAEAFAESCQRFARSGTGTEARVMRQVGLPIVIAAIAHGHGDYATAVDALLPVRDRVRTIGGSHAQRDVFAQLLIDAAWKAGRFDVASMLLDERLAARPANLWGWKHRALVLDAQGARGADDARREHERLRAIQTADGRSA
jgi:tetratricopeptide (TPR) repeat protein